VGKYFAYDYHGAPFVLFGAGHLAFLAVVTAIALFLIYGWKNPSEKAKRRGRHILIAVIVIGEASWHLWNIYWGHWTIQTMLPLHMCSMMINLAIIMLITRNYRLYEYVYFLGIGGAMQPVLTPEAGIYGLPHFRAFQTLTVHSALLLSGIYMTAVEGFRPTWRSFWRVFVFTNLYAAVVYVINLLIGSNYLFIMEKPATASLMDILGPWPWYLVSLEAIAFIIFFMLYLPFAIKDWRANKMQTAMAK